MAYCGYITTLKNVRPHSNADRLQLGDCFGNTVVVSLEYTEGQLGVYFPTDGQLSLEFASKNNLLRRKDENGENVGGYMDPDKRNICAIRLRGEKSDGLFLPLESLASFGDITKLKEGDKIDIFNGTEICCKYIPRRNPSKREGNGGKGNRTRKKSFPIAPLFKEHADTEQLAYNLDAFKCGDLVELTLKAHGCFIPTTKVRMADGDLKEIRSVRLGDKVLAYNFEKKCFDTATVKTVFRHDKSYNWNKIKISRNGLAGDRRGYITSTPNHPYWVEELQGWVEAKDLTPGMKISCAFPSEILTAQQKSLLVGNFLGDGCLQDFEGKAAEMQSGVKLDKKEYGDFIIDLSNSLYYGEKKTYTSGYGTEMFRFKTHRTADIHRFFDNIIDFSATKKSSNRLKPEFVEEFTPLAMAIFYMDDGNLGHSDTQKDRANFAICDFGEHDANIIGDCFRKFDIEPKVYLDSAGYYRIRLNTAEAYKMFDLIYKFIPPCMRYKLPSGYRDLEYTPPVDDEERKIPYIFVQQEVLENIPLNEGYVEWDLETSLHNYVVGNAVVHNTSQRTAYLPVLKPTKKNLFDKIFHREGKPIYEWDYVSGTRRVVLDDFSGGYYGNDSFRKTHHDFFVGKLLKGETVYYEIVGYTDTGIPIMPSADNKKTQDKEFIKKYGKTTEFSYGCSPCGEDGKPTSDIYVYRMTMTNEDGDVVEYAPDFMRYRCEQMGAKYVPVLWRGIIPPDVNAGEFINNLAERYNDGADPIGKTHVREGVVARIINRPKFTAYKSKNFSFKILSNIAVANAEASGALDNMSEDELSEM